jgi:hypothetical protein
VVDVGVRGDQHLATAEGEIELADQLDDFVHRFLKADVDQQPFLLIEHQINIAAEDLPRLKVQLNDIRQNRFARQHANRPTSTKIQTSHGILEARSIASNLRTACVALNSSK